MQVPPLVLWVNAGLIFFCVFAWGIVLRRLWRREPLIACEPRQPVPWRGTDLLLVLAIEFLVVQVYLTLGFALTGVERPKDWSAPSADVQILVIVCGTLANLTTFVSAALIAIYRAGADARDLGLAWHAAPRDAWYGAVAFAASAPILYGMQLFFSEVLHIDYEHPLIEALEARPGAGTWWLMLACAVAVAPVVEEFLFRVMLQGWLEQLELRRANRSASAEVPSEVTDNQLPLAGGWFGLPLGTGPILISAALFGLMHWGNGAAPVPLFFFGLVLGYLYQRTHRLVPSLVAHLMLNSVSTFMLYMTLKS